MFGQTEVATQMARAAQDVSANFVISVGDNFYENGVTSTEDDHWQASFEKVFHAPSLQIPWYVILGNHDYRGDCDAQLAYSKISSRWKMPARYFMQSHTIAPGVTADFFYLDTNPMIQSYHGGGKFGEHIGTQDEKAQLAWFKKELAASKAQWKLVFGHHPIYSGGGHGDSKDLIKTILPVLQEHKVQAYFNGHDHDLQHLMAGNLNLFDTGAGSKLTPTKETSHTKFAASKNGFTQVNVSNDTMNVRMIDATGALLYSVSIPRVMA